MTKEKYYAVRIGAPKRNWPYFMLGADSKTPALFATRGEAETACPKQPATRVVRVWLHDSANNALCEGAKGNDEKHK